MSGSTFDRFEACQLRKAASKLSVVVLMVAGNALSLDGGAYAAALTNRPSASDLEEVVDAGTWCERAIEERERAVSWCGPTQTVFSFSRFGDHDDLAAARSWVTSNATHFADFRYNMATVFQAGTVFDVIRLNPTNLVALAGLPANVFDESAKTNWWRMAYTNQYGWHALRRAVTNLKWVVARNVTEVAGKRIYTEGQSVSVYLCDSSREYEWVSALCDEPFSGMLTNMLSANILESCYTCANDQYTISFSKSRMRAFANFDPDTNECAGACELFAIDHIIGQYSDEWGSWAMVAVHPDIAFDTIDVYALLPMITNLNDTSECFAGLDSLETNRPSYIPYETVYDVGNQPPGVTLPSGICTWDCLLVGAENAEHAFTTAPFYPFAPFWETVTYSTENETCEACRVEPYTLWYDTYLDYIYQAQSNRFGCTWSYGDIQEESRFIYSFNGSFQTVAHTNSLGEVLPRFIAIIKYDFEYD